MNPIDPAAAPVSSSDPLEMIVDSMAAKINEIARASGDPKSKIKEIADLLKKQDKITALLSSGGQVYGSDLVEFNESLAIVGGCVVAIAAAHDSGSHHASTTEMAGISQRRLGRVVGETDAFMESAPGLQKGPDVPHAMSCRGMPRRPGQPEPIDSKLSHPLALVKSHLLSGLCWRLSAPERGPAKQHQPCEFNKNERIGSKRPRAFR